MDKQPPLSRIYVGNIPWNIDEITFYNTFQHIGQIYEARIIIDKHTNRSKGFGFITFMKDEDAQKAIDTMNGIDLAGRPIKVNFATPHIPAVRPTVLPPFTINNGPLPSGIRSNHAPIYYMASVNNNGTPVDINNRNDNGQLTVSGDRSNVHPSLMNSINPNSMLIGNVTNPYYSSTPTGYLSNHASYQAIPWNMIPSGPNTGYYNGTYPIISSPHHHLPSSSSPMSPSTNNSYPTISTLSPSSAAMYQIPYYPIGSSPTGQAIANNAIGLTTTAESYSSSTVTSQNLGSSSSANPPNTSNNTSASPNPSNVTNNSSPTKDNIVPSATYLALVPPQSSPTTNG